MAVARLPPGAWRTSMSALLRLRLCRAAAIAALRFDTTFFIGIVESGCAQRHLRGDKSAEKI
jgi:hypothetical protein